ncbi:MAG: TetR/AcrR family transcriptional regulator [Desulfovibrionaceae bacterium]
MSHPASPRFEHLDPDKRERILEAATDEFAAHGYHQASVNRLVRAVGIAKGSIFQYFGTKQGLFEYLFGRWVEQFKAPLKAVRQANPDFFERVRGSLRAGLEFIRSHPRIYRVYLSMLYQENVPFRDTFLRQVRSYSSEYLGELVDEARAAGQLRPDLDTAAAVFLLDALLDRFLQARALPIVNEELHGLDEAGALRRIDELVDCLRRGMAAQPHNRPSED